VRHLWSVMVAVDKPNDIWEDALRQMEADLKKASTLV
jgi:hypothetical protein